MATYSTPFAGATVSIAGWGSWDRIFFDNGVNWTVGAYWKIEVSSTEGFITLGHGRISGGDFICCLTLNNRMYLGVGSSFAGSENNDPTLWEEQNPGALIISIRNQAGFIDKVYGLSSFQGRLAVFGRYNISIWNIDADPANFSQAQLLQNIGTLAPLSVQALGDLDCMFLDATGIRSLRAREVTLNATPGDVGTPIDRLVQALLLTLTDDQKQASCGIVEPNDKRFWLAINGTMYVFSYYPSSQISAWSTYGVPSFYGPAITPTSSSGSGAGTITSYAGLDANATYLYTVGSSLRLRVVIPLDYPNVIVKSGTITGVTSVQIEGVPTGSSLKQLLTFVASKFVIHQGRVYMLGNDNKVYIYGGSDNNTFDYTSLIIETPYLDDKKPATGKQAIAVDMAIEGAWTIKAGMDPKSKGMETVAVTGDGSSPDMDIDSPFDAGAVAYVARGTHFKLRAESSPFSMLTATLSGLIFHYNEEDAE